MTSSAVIAANRFGLGARPGELERIGRDGGRAWLMAQIERPDRLQLRDPALLTSAGALAAFAQYRQARAAARSPTQAMVPAAGPGDGQRLAAVTARTLGAEIEARVQRAVTTEDSFAERWVHFWSNWFTVAARNAQTIPLPGPFEREVIRAHAMGRFADMALAATAHPGMLIYLDQAQSVGPGSQAGNRRGAGLNENLARELLELHTLGPDGGYSQADVTELARALTGWTVTGRQMRGGAPGEPGTFVFLAAMHEPGARTVRGKQYREGGVEQGRAIIADLARDPAIGVRVAKAVATHFVADDPAPALVARLNASFMRSGGDLRALARTLIESPEAWQPEPRKFKTPHDFLVSALRAGGVREVSFGPLRATFEQLGQPPFRAPSPKGWPDTAPHWAAPDAILKRADWAQLAGERLNGSMTPIALAEGALGPALSSRLRTAIARAESGTQGFVLALMSPEFQRR